jgi:predicted Zn-dependent protease
MILGEQEVKDITGRRLAASRAEGCIVRVNGEENVNLRFAGNSATSNGAISEVSVTVTSHFGRQSGSATVTSLDEHALDAAQRHSEEIARLTPADPEHMPPLGPQHYGAGVAFDAATAEIGAAPLAQAARSAIGKAVGEGVAAAGYGAAGGRFHAMATSAGLFAYDRQSHADFTVTARRGDGSWSGWAGGSDYRFAALDMEDIGERAAQKAAHSQPPIDLDPGQYTVILEPSAVGELLYAFFWLLDAREADEGRSWLSAKDGATKLGEQLLGARVTLYSDPADPLAPHSVFDREGLPYQRAVWIENGIIKTLAYSRYWAEKTGNAPRAGPGGLVMAGGTASMEEMIRGTSRGILVTRVWYTNTLDPRTLLMTGLTRDGNFLIENGRIVGPARNFRFNESLIAMLSNIEAMGPTRRIHGGDLGFAPVAAPPLLVKSFTFSSRSAGI